MINNEKTLFEELNEKLKELDETLEIICAGGIILQHYGIRATQDVDSFYTSNAKIESAIKQVGEKHGINNDEELWLNNSIQNLNRTPPIEICQTIYKFSNLRVLFPPIEYIICMKLNTGRGQDVKDAGALIVKENIQNPNVIQKASKKYGFGDIDDGMLLEAFGEAYGQEWLAEYYINISEKRYLMAEDRLGHWDDDDNPMFETENKYDNPNN